MDLKKIYLGRKTRWCLSDKTPHGGLELLPSTENLLRMGFSPQYFFLMTILSLGIIFLVYAVDLWIIWGYNPFKDPVMIVCIPIVGFTVWIWEKFLIFIGKKMKIWQLKTENQHEV